MPVVVDVRVSSLVSVLAEVTVLVMTSRAVDAIVVSVTVAVSVNVMVLSSIGAALVKLSKCVSSKQPHV